MNALAMTGAAIARTLTSLAAEPTLAEVDKWSRENRRYTNFLWAAETIAGLPETTPVWEARYELLKRITREESKRERGHWSFDANRLIALKQMVDHLEAFESARRDFV